jgi:carbon monoxide dehydrogenase subunit G
MKAEGERTFAAPRELVWAILNDPANMAGLMPGVQSFEIRDPRNWTAAVKVPLGLGSLAMTIDFEQTEVRPPEYSSLHAKGNGVGAIMNMQTSFTLEEQANGTRMLWSADVKILGPVGAMGQRVLQPIVKQQVNLVLGALERRVTSAVGDDAAAGAGGEPEPAGGAGQRPAPTG